MAIRPNSFQDRALKLYKETWRIWPPWNEPRAVFMASTAFRISGPSASGPKSNKAKTWRISPRKRALPISSTAPSVGPSATPASPPWETKWEIEKHIRQLGLPATVFRPAGFMEIYHMLELEVGLLIGRFLDPVRHDKTYQSIATDDIGAFVALAFDRPEEFIGMELEIAGSELTPRQTADVFSRVMGKPVKYGRLPMLAVRLLLGKEFYAMFRWFNREGFQANIPELRRKYPEVHLHSLEEWLREDGWDKRGLRFRAPKG